MREPRWRRDLRRPPGTEAANFDEYAHLHHEAWSEPPARWLMSTVPVSVIFDDHDVRDDWNTFDGLVEQAKVDLTQS